MVTSENRSLSGRVVVGLAASGAVSAAALRATVTSASASTIPYQHVQVCAQGNYSAYALFRLASAGSRQS